MRSGLALQVPPPAAMATGDEFELRNPHPIVATLPGVFRESWLDEQRRTAREPFGTRFISALDSVLAPVITTIDNVDMYFDADTTPEDFLGWLGSWVAASVDAGWPEDRRRAFVGQAAELYRRRGTADGLRDHVQIHTGGIVEIIENGASSWSPTADGKLPGTPEPVVVIRVTVDDPDAIDRVKLDELVVSSKPAHVVHRIEVLGTAQRAGRKAKADAPAPLDVAAVVADEKAEARKASKAGGDEVMPTPKAEAAPSAEAAPAAAAESAEAEPAAGSAKAEARKAGRAAGAEPAAEPPPAPPAETAEGDEPAS